MKGRIEVIVVQLPHCDICREYDKSELALYDAKTIYGFWANLCEFHFKFYGIGLGLGKGQKLVLKRK